MNGHEIQHLSALLASGFCPDGMGRLSPLLHGLAHRTESGLGWVAGRYLLDTRQALQDNGEAVAALLATDKDLRRPWVRILAARAREAGRLDDPSVLIQLVTRLGEAAAWVEGGLKGADLAATSLGELERELLGVGAEQASAVPKLTRIMRAAARLVAQRGDALATLPEVDRSGARPDRNWCPGRLLSVPGRHADEAYLLVDTSDRGSDADSLEWVLAHPWAFLLAAVIYAQYSWAAESRGGLLLELPAGQAPQLPQEVRVLVAGPDGDELLCGSLGELVTRALDRLQIGLFPHSPEPGELNSRLAPIIESLLRRKVWRYRETLSGQQGIFDIHPDFADACYRIAGARSFGRHGRAVWQAIRIQAEQWRAERYRPPARMATQ